MRPSTVDPFQAIGDPNRRVMLNLLSKESLTINSLARHFAMTRPAVSKHLKILHTAGFISIEDVGRERHCKLNPKGFEDLHQWIGYFDQFWQTKMANLDNLLNEKYKK